MKNKETKCKAKIQPTWTWIMHHSLWKLLLVQAHLKHNHKNPHLSGSLMDNIGSTNGTMDHMAQHPERYDQNLDQLGDNYERLY